MKQQLFGWLSAMSAETIPKKKWGNKQIGYLQEHFLRKLAECSSNDPKKTVIVQRYKEELKMETTCMNNIRNGKSKDPHDSSGGDGNGFPGLTDGN